MSKRERDEKEDEGGEEKRMKINEELDCIEILESLKKVKEKVKKVKEFLRSEFEKKVRASRTIYGRKGTYLHFAAFLRDVDATKMLIEDNAEVNAVDERKYTALHYAAIEGHADVAKVLIQNGADVNVKSFWNNLGRSALHFAAWKGHVEVAKVLIQNGADVYAVDKREQSSVLHYAAEHGHADVAKVLIQNGADVYDANNRDTTALHKAVRKGHADVVKLLIQNDAEVDAVEDFWDDGGWWKFTALHSAADNGDVEIVKMLIHSHCEVNAVENKFEIPPLHMAANKGHAEVVKILIQNGAVVNAVCNHWNALELAASWGQVEVGKILISNGAIDLESPLYYAVCNHEVAFTLQLLCLGAKINYRHIKNDETKLLRPIKDRVESLRAGNGMKTTLMSDEERRFMWNLAFSFTIKHGGATAFKAYYSIRSFITFHGIFMGPGYDLGDGSIWRKEWPEDFCGGYGWPGPAMR